MKMRIEVWVEFQHRLKASGLRLIDYEVIHHGSMVEIIGGEIAIAGLWDNKYQRV